MGRRVLIAYQWGWPRGRARNGQLVGRQVSRARSKDREPRPFTPLGPTPARRPSRIMNNGRRFARPAGRPPAAGLARHHWLISAGGRGEGRT